MTQRTSVWMKLLRFAWLVPFSFAWAFGVSVVDGAYTAWDVLVEEWKET